MCDTTTIRLLAGVEALLGEICIVVDNVSLDDVNTTDVNIFDVSYGDVKPSASSLSPNDVITSTRSCLLAREKILRTFTLVNHSA